MGVYPNDVPKNYLDVPFHIHHFYGLFLGDHLFSDILRCKISPMILGPWRHPSKSKVSGKIEGK